MFEKNKIKNINLLDLSEEDKKLLNSFLEQELKAHKKKKKSLLTLNNTNPYSFRSPGTGFFRRSRVVSFKISHSIEMLGFDANGNRLLGVLPASSDKKNGDIAELGMPDSDDFFGKNNILLKRFVRVLQWNKDGGIRVNADKEYLLKPCGINNEPEVLQEIKFPSSMIVYLDAQKHDKSSQNDLLIELIPGKDLLKLLSDKTVLEKINFLQGLHICLGIVGAVDWLHSQGLVHSDLKPQNIITSIGFGELSTDIPIVPIDFESAYSGRIRRLLKNGGKTGYHAPELAESDYGTKPADRYAVGVILEAIARNFRFEAKLTPGQWKKFNELTVKLTADNFNDRGQDLSEAIAQLNQIRIEFGSFDEKTKKAMSNGCQQAESGFIQLKLIPNEVTEENIEKLKDIIIRHLQPLAPDPLAIKEFTETLALLGMPLSKDLKTYAEIQQKLDNLLSGFRENLSKIKVIEEEIKKRKKFYSYFPCSQMQKQAALNEKLSREIQHIKSEIQKCPLKLGHMLALNSQIENLLKADSVILNLQKEQQDFLEAALQPGGPSLEMLLQKLSNNPDRNSMEFMIKSEVIAYIKETATDSNYKRKDRIFSSRRLADCIDLLEIFSKFDLSDDNETRITSIKSKLSQMKFGSVIFSRSELRSKIMKGLAQFQVAPKQMKFR